MATVFRIRKGEVVTNYGDDGGGEELLLTRQTASPEIEVCSLCQEPQAAAYWRGGGGDFRVCRRCAVHTLPLLMADALVGEYGETPAALAGVHGGLQEATANFWRGVALAVSRAARLATAEARKKGRQP